MVDRLDKTNGIGYNRGRLYPTVGEIQEMERLLEEFGLKEQNSLIGKAKKFEDFFPNHYFNKNKKLLPPTC